MKNDLVQNLLKQYTIPETSPVELLRESGDNLVFLIGSTDKKILRLSKRLPKTDVQFEYDVISHFYTIKFPVPLWIKTINKHIFSSIGTNNIAVLFDYIEGYHATVNKNIMPNYDQAKSAGYSLGLISQFGRSFKSRSPRKRTIFSELERVLKYQQKFIQLFEGGETFVNEVKRAIKFGKRAKTNICLIHNDYRPSNVFFKNDREVIGIIDFDWSCIGPQIKDLALGVLEWSFPDGRVEPDITVFDAFLDGYNSASARKITRGVELYAWIQFSALSDTATYFCDRLEHPAMKRDIKSSFMYKKYMYFKPISKIK